MSAADDYQDLRAKAMCDLVRDPRAVVFAADVVIGEMEEQVNAAVSVALHRTLDMVAVRERAEAAEAEVERLRSVLTASQLKRYEAQREGRG